MSGSIAALTAALTAGQSIDDVVDGFLGGDDLEPAAPLTEEVEHVASAADLEADYSATVPGFPEHLEKLADWCDGFVGQLEELPKTAALTGDLRFDFSDDLRTPTVPGKDPAIESMLERVLGHKED